MAPFLAPLPKGEETSPEKRGRGGENREGMRLRSGTDSSGNSSPYSSGDRGSSNSRERGEEGGRGSYNIEHGQNIMSLLNSVQKAAAVALRSTDSSENLHSSSSGSNATLRSIERDREVGHLEYSPGRSGYRKSNPVSYGAVPMTSTYFTFFVI